MLALVSIARSLYRGDAFCICFVNINLAKRRVRDVIKMAYNRLMLFIETINYKTGKCVIRRSIKMI